MKTLKSKIALLGTTALATVAGTASAQEAFDPNTVMSGAVADVQETVNSLASDWWPVLVSVFVIVVGMKLFKKFGNRATS